MILTSDGGYGTPLEFSHKSELFTKILLVNNRRVWEPLLLAAVPRGHIASFTLFTMSWFGSSL